ncbi:MAG: hypothetical protein CMP11_07785 [Zetaproteobacteria bacterium]|nr:hypothetical protein [Pseudobdellovibrionaceae bacterium]
MKKIYVARHQIEAEFVKDFFEKEGFFVEVKNTASTDIYQIDSGQIILVKDEDFQRAQKLLSEFEEVKKRLMEHNMGKNWICSNCHEENEGQFDSCWSCQTPRS